jgi:hypothetical protein
VETHLLIAQRVGIASSNSLQPLLEMSESVGKLLRLLIRKLSSS